MISKQEVIEELKVKEPHIIRNELQEKLSKSEHFKQIQNNLFEATCGKRRKLRMPARYDAAQVLRQLVPWVGWDGKVKDVVDML